jgi:HD-like signal output (HDOD) protein
MIFKGDLSKYHPADAMMFLSQVGVDGVLSVAEQECIISLTFKAGRLLDAQSASGDRKLLRCLQHEGRLNDSQVRHIQRIQRETGLSVRQLLGKLDFFPLIDIQATLKMGMLEVLRQLFLLDHGSFNFTETPVEDDGARILIDTGRVTLKILPQADEYRDFKKSILSTERTVYIHGDVKALKNITPSGQLVLNLAGRRPSVNELLDQASLFSHEVLQYVQQFLAQGIISLELPRKVPLPSTGPTLDPMFSAFKQALKTLLSNHEVLARLEAMISFGKIYYDDMLILTARQGEFIHCKTIRMDPDKGLAQRTIKGHFGRIDDDAVFATVCRSGIAFFGKTFPCNLLNQFINQSPHGECALIPILISSNLSMFFYVCTNRNYSGLSPHHYLELLSWIIALPQNSSIQLETPMAGATGNQGLATVQDGAEQNDPSSEDAQKRIAKMVGRIKDLPPLPTLVSKVLQMLSDPETPFEDIESVISRDQALVAKLIKVGNSALYGGLQKVSSLRQVLTRLGLKTTRNLVLTASTRSYFLNNRKTMRVWGQFLWQHAVETGLAARRIAEITHYPDPEEAFVGGLIHDIGKLIMLMLFAKPYIEILKMKKVNQVASKSAEMRVLNCNHEQIGRLLMDRWNMPESAKACAEYHHRYHESDGYGDLVAVVAYADYLSRRYGGNPESLLAEDHAYGQELVATLKLSEDNQATLVAAVIDDFQKAELMME